MVPHRAAFGETAALTVEHVAMRGRPDGYLSLDNVWSAAGIISDVNGVHRDLAPYALISKAASVEHN